MKKIYSLLAITAFSFASQAQVVISQVYGGGGNNGATYSNDFIELFNRGTVAQSLNGWSVQYASANGTTWSQTNLPDVTLQPGQYFLIQEAVGSTPVLALPTPDLNGITCGCSYDSSVPPKALTTGLAMSGSNGKVILVNTTTQEAVADPTGPQIMDKVAYGATSTSGFEGSGPTGVALTNSTAAQRVSAGCTDTNNNPTDFAAATPAPRNTASPVNNCSFATNKNTISGLNIYPNPVTNGTLYINSDSNAEKTVAIFDVLGKQVLRAATSTGSINVSSLNTGVYMLQITEEGKTATRKLVIQ